MDEFDMFSGDADLSDATNLFFSTFVNKGEETPPDAHEEKKPKAPEAEEEHNTADEDTPETEEAETEDDASPSEDGEETEEGSEEEEREFASDGAYAKIKVGDKEEFVPVKDLTRLYGQESALTKRSQEVANQRADVEKKQAEHLAASNVMLNAARQRYAPYAKLDFVSIARNPNVSEKELTALRQEAQARHDELQFLEHSTGEYMKQIQDSQHARFQAEAKASVQALTDEASPYHIEGWNQQTYDNLRSFALEKGVPMEAVNQIIHPSIVKLIHNAMQYDKGTKALVKTEKVGKKVTKVMKTSRAPETNSKGKNSGKAVSKLQRSGTQEDAANAFLSKFSAFGDVD